MENNRIKEKELVLPALYLLDTAPGGSLSTAQLIERLAGMMHPTGQDAEILEGRNDTYFSQKVRNLKSHGTLERQGWAGRTAEGFRITEAGRQFVADNRENIRSLSGGEFAYDSMRQVFGQIAEQPERKLLALHEEEVVVEEGMPGSAQTQAAVRSRKLRQAAIEHFTHDGHLRCRCCGFEFAPFYGDRYGASCIEIHHIKPIVQYGDTDFSKTLGEALKNLMPVCPNCHRVIHRNHIGPGQMDDFLKDMRSAHPW